MTGSNRARSNNRPIRAALFLAVLVVLGITGNLMSLPLALGVEFFFGSIAVLLALRIYGFRWGLLAAAAAAGCTLYLRQPLSFPIFMLEALFVGYFLKRRGETIIIPGVVFWVCIGFPTVWLFNNKALEVDFQIALLISLKAAVNGIFNALAANVLYTHLPLEKWAGIGREPNKGNPASLRQLLFNVLVSMVIFPALILMAVDNQREQADMQKEIETIIENSSAVIINNFRTWEQEHLKALTELARLAGRDDLTTEELQKSAAILRMSHSDIIRVHIDDAEGTSRVFSPDHDENGKPAVGLNFSDRDYYRVLKETQQPVVSDVFMGRVGNPVPIATMGVPIIVQNRFAGYVIASVDISYVSARLLDITSPVNKLEATLVDSKGRAVASTRSGISPTQVLDRKEGGRKAAFGDNVFHWIPGSSGRQPGLVRWQESFYITEKQVGRYAPWTLVTEVSMAPFLRKAMDSNVKNMAGILVLATLALVFADIICRRLVGPVSSLAGVTTNLPEKIFHGQAVAWPTSSLSEMTSLVSNFKSMAATLRENFNELQTAKMRVEEEKNTLEAIIAGIGDGISIQDTNFRIMFQNSIHKDLMGDHMGEYCYTAYENREDVCENCPVQMSFCDGIVYTTERHPYTLDGKNQIHVEITSSPLRNIVGEIFGVIEVVRDISERTRAEEERRQIEQMVWQEKERAMVTLHSIGDAVISTDARGGIEYLNPVAEELTGWNNEEARGKPLLKAFRISSENGEKLENPVEYCIHEGKAGGFSSNNAVLTDREGHKYVIEYVASPIKEGAGRIIGAVLVFRDITERRNMMQQLVYQAHHDSLTDVPNRILFVDRLTLELARTRSQNGLLAVMFLDLDRFKRVNDMLGHAFGDQLLQNVVNRLQTCVRDCDTISRLGGDEFAILLPKVTGREDVEIIALRVLSVMREPWLIAGQEFHITTSIGISMYPFDGEDPDTLLKNADMAMYRAKESGRNNFCFYTPVLNIMVHERLSLENSLHRALELEQFVVYYQPQVDINSGQITGMEALVRWVHPELGLVVPDKFIPAAEETGLIVPIGEWVLRRACTQNREWQKAGFTPVRVAVNISGRQFMQPDLAAKIAEILQETGMEPRCLELEITESVAMQDAEFTAAILSELNNMGIRIAIDDFGTGYSSLNYLKRFPITTLKIDRMFLRDIPENRDNAAIVNTIIVLGHNMGIDIIAEGVESQAQLDFLRKRNCNKMQGFLCSKPVPADEAEGLLQKFLL